MSQLRPRMAGMDFDTEAETLLPKPSTPSDSSVSENGCTLQKALRNNPVRQGIFNESPLSTAGKRLKVDIRKIAEKPAGEHGGMRMYH